MPSNNAPWYHIQQLEAIDTPALVVYLDRVQQNIALLKASIDDTARLRPHVKTHKTAAATQLLLDAGLKKAKCATIAEAELLAAAGVPDVLLAYQPVGPKADRFLSLMHHFPDTVFSCLVDAENVALALSQKAAAASVVVSVYIDLNVGMNRTGIRPEAALELYQFCAALPGLAPVGLHVYDGHITDTDMKRRTEKCNAAFASVEALCEALQATGFSKPHIVAGGSATFPIHAQRADVECSPGTFIFWDAGYSRLLPEQPFQPAALVLTRVVSKPTPNTICTDLGHKAVAAENDLSRRVFFLNAPDLKPVSQSEEHLVVEAPEGHAYQIGDVLYGLPQHICPTCNLYSRALVVEDEMIVAEWKISARDRTLNF